MRWTNQNRGVTRLLFFACVGLLLLAGAARELHAIQLGPFDPSGAGGALNGQTLLVEDGGSVFEIDAFIQIEGLDLNDAGPGTAARVSTDSLPPELTLSFSSELSGDESDLTLRYRIDNTGASPLAGLTFLSLFDAEIDQGVNTFFNEFAETTGSLAIGQSFEVDEPGFGSGDLFANLLAGQLDGVNAVAEGFENDVAMALSFALGPLSVGDSALVELLVSEDGDSLGSFSIRHLDADPLSTTEITYSGRATVVPEPSTLTLLLLGLATLRGGMKQRR